MINSVTEDYYTSFIQEGYRRGATPKPKIFIIKNWTQQRNASSETSISNSSTPELPIKQVTSEERLQFTNEIGNKERQYDQLISQIEQRLMVALNNYSLESEILSKSEELICEIVDNYSLRVLGEVLTSIYIKCYGVQNVIAGICSGLERFDAEEVFPWGHSIVIGLINHKSDLVKERVISLIENWGDASLLTALKSIDISSDWMREYVNEVISYLEDK